jgi:putative lipoprotein
MARTTSLAFVLALGLVLAVLPGCRPAADSTPEPQSAAPTPIDSMPLAGTATLSGSVVYLPRIALDPAAEVTVTLQDVSQADAPAVPIASTTFKAEGRQVPLPFSLTYEPARIEEERSYSLAARIQKDGELLWSTDTVVPVLTRGAPRDSVDVRVVQSPK